MSKRGVFTGVTHYRKFPNRPPLGYVAILWTRREFDGLYLAWAVDHRGFKVCMGPGKWARVGETPQAAARLLATNLENYLMGGTR
jgi:hypothetical protein